MLQAPKHLSLQLEAPHVLLGAQARAQDLQRDDAIRAGLAGPVHHPHAVLPNDIEDLVAADAPRESPDQSRSLGFRSPSRPAAKRPTTTGLLAGSGRTAREG